MTLRRTGLIATVVALYLLGTIDLVQHYETEPLLAFTLSAARALPLLLHRRWPLVAWLVTLAAVLVTALLTAPVSGDEPWPWPVTSVGALAALSVMSMARGARRTTAVMLAVVAGLSVVLFVWPGRGDWTSGPLALLVCGVGALVGHMVHSRSSVVAELAEERQVSATEREMRAVVEERARIARELHDVVAHHMSMITVQAETAAFRHDDLPASAVQEFTEIAHLARTSLSELRGLLSALRDDAADPTRAPQPTLADLPALVERVAAAGTPVTLTAPPDTGDLPRVVQLATYRIVQEALSNVVRHAAGAPTEVVLTRTDDALRVEVANGRPSTPPHPGGQGHGLTGLRERATLLGGTFTVDHPGGGWRVTATLPL